MYVFIMIKIFDNASFPAYTPVNTCLHTYQNHRALSFVMT